MEQKADEGLKHRIEILEDNIDKLFSMLKLVHDFIGRQNEINDKVTEALKLLNERCN